MACVVLIIPPGRYSTALHYDRYVRTPLEGVTALGGVLQQHKHDVLVIDCRGNSGPLEDFVVASLPPSPAIIGFTTFFDSFRFVESCVPLLRRVRPKALIAVGGPLATGAPGPFLTHAHVDIVVRGEGERALLAIADAVDGNASVWGVPGTLQQSQGGEIVDHGPVAIVEDLDELPDVDWTYAGARLAQGGFDFMYSVGRGCQQRCTYCSRPLGRRRFRSPQKVRRELDYLHSRYGMNSVILNDSDLVYENPELDSYVGALHGIGVQWGCFTGPRGLSVELLARLHACGCTNLRVGIEALDEGMITRHRPDYSLTDMLRTLDLLDAGPIEKVTCYFLLGLPGQTERSLDMILSGLQRYPRLVPRPFYLIPMPGTVVFEDAVRCGLVESTTAYLRRLHGVPIDAVSDRLPHLADASRLRIADVYVQLVRLAVARSGSADCPILP